LSGGCPSIDRGRVPELQQWDVMMVWTGCVEPSLEIPGKRSEGAIWSPSVSLSIVPERVSIPNLKVDDKTRFGGYGST
jgi:hypothetical protein